MGHGGVDLCPGGVVGDAQLGRKGQALLHGQVIVHDVLLRHVAQHGLKSVTIIGGVQAVEPHAALGAGRSAGDAGKQAGLSGSGAAHQHHKAVGLDFKAGAVHDVQRLAGVAVFDGLIHIEQLHADAAFMLVVMQQPAGKSKYLRRHVDDRTAAQHCAGHAGTVHIGAVGGAQIAQLVVAVLVQNFAVMAGYAVADKLDVAVIATADEHPLFAADIHLPQDGVVSLLLPQAGLAALGCANFLNSKRDFLRRRIAVGVQAQHVTLLQGAGLALVQVAVVVPGRALGGGIGHGPAVLGAGHHELHLAHVVAAQHIFTLSTAAKTVTARRQGDALFVALLGN